VCINAQGDAYLSINQGDGTASKLPTFKQATTGVGGLIMPGVAPQEFIRMADIDGDGRADYVWVRENNEVHVWRNGGTAWIVGETAGGSGKLPLSKFGPLIDNLFCSR
jgi:hypothetical protein